MVRFSKLGGVARQAVKRSSKIAKRVAPGTGFPGGAQVKSLARTSASQAMRTAAAGTGSAVKEMHRAKTTLAGAGAPTQKIVGNTAKAIQQSGKLGEKALTAARSVGQAPAKKVVNIATRTSRRSLDAMSRLPGAAKGAAARTLVATKEATEATGQAIHKTTAGGIAKANAAITFAKKDVQKTIAVGKRNAAAAAKGIKGALGKLSPTGFLMKIAFVGIVGVIVLIYVGPKLLAAHPGAGAAMKLSGA